MATSLKQSGFYLDDVYVAVTRKRIKNLHLSVRPPDGRVAVSAPLRTSDETIRAFVHSKNDWIRKHLQRIQKRQQDERRERATPGVWFQGQCLPLTVVESSAKPMVVHSDRGIMLRVHPGTDAGKRQALLERWYRNKLTACLPALFARYEPLMGVKVNEFRVRKMKTRWGTCNYRVGRIWINLDLVRRPPELLEYIVVHEMAHLLEPSHNRHFVALMDRYSPRWREHRRALRQYSLRFDPLG